MGKNKIKVKVMAAMSGGVDSSVAAYLLKKSGYEVTGVTMCLGISDNEKNLENPGQNIISKCCGMDSIKDAADVCSLLGINHYVYDFSVHMQEFIIKPFIESYLKGRTPNPCIECNRFLKFGILLEKAKVLGFDYIATGHYAGIVKVNGLPFLARALDRKKDQSYFLYSIMKKNLGNIIFPLHKLTKQEVRKIACDIGLKISDKKDSQEICFITNDNYRDFIKESKVKGKNITGKIIDTSGRILGEHHGVFNYTIGQRKGIGISASYPLYVQEINIAKNLVVVGSRSYLEKRRLIARDANLFVDKLPACAKAKIRYNHEEASCRIAVTDNDSLEVTFEQPQSAISPGQSIVFYKDDIVLGGAVISDCIH